MDGTAEKPTDWLGMSDEEFAAADARRAQLTRRRNLSQIKRELFQLAEQHTRANRGHSFGWLFALRGVILSLREMEQKKQVQSVPSAADRLYWTLHPRRSELPPNVRVKDPFERGGRPGLGGSTERKGK